MTEFDRLNGCIEWIDLSFVEHERTPKWAIQVASWYHLAGMSTTDASQFVYKLRVKRSHIAVRNWVHKANLQPISIVSADQLAVDEKVIRIDGEDYWLYGAVNPETYEILQFKLFPTTTKQTTRRFLAELHQRYRLDGVKFLVDDAEYLADVLDEDGYRFQMISHGNRNAIERVFWEIERRTFSFAMSFNCVEPQTAES